MRSIERKASRRGARLPGPIHHVYLWLLVTAIVCAVGNPIRAQPRQGSVSEDVFSGGSAGSSGRGTYPTGTQSQQPNDAPCNNPYGCGRGIGLSGAIDALGKALGGLLNSGPAGGPSPPGRDVYCQQSPGMPMYGPYRGTGTQTPCGPAFQAQPLPSPPPSVVPPDPGAYAQGFVTGFLSCLGATALMPVQIGQQIFTDLGIYRAAAEAMLRGDSGQAADLLQIKGVRDRNNFAGFVNSILNPNIYGVDPGEAGRRNGFRICAFWVIPSLLNKLSKPKQQGAVARPSIWTSVTPMGPNRPGTPVPTSFILTTPNGRVFVAGNATEHLAEWYVGMQNRSVHPDLINLGLDLQLESLQGAVNEAIAGSPVFDTRLAVGGWKLVFRPPRTPDELPALIHLEAPNWR